MTGLGVSTEEDPFKHLCICSMPYLGRTFLCRNMDNFIFWGLCSKELGFRACIILHVSVSCVWGPEPLVTVTVRRQREHEVFLKGALLL